MEPIWLTYAKRLQAIAATGLSYKPHVFDQERYEEVAEIAARMMAELGQVPLAALQAGLDRPGDGHVTPKIDVRGAVIREGRILLVQEECDGLWTLPGGYADVGLSGGENVAKEVWEEAGLRVRASRLYALRHKARHEYQPDHREFYKLYYLCEETEVLTPQVGPETSDVGFFAPDALPPLSRGRTIEGSISAAFAALADPGRAVEFD